MNGLEAIKERILADAREAASAIMFRADEQIAKINAEASQKAAELLNEASEQAEKNSLIIDRRAQSMAALENRKARLTARRELVDQVLEQAVNRLSTLPDREKEEIYVKMLQSVDDGISPGEIEFSERDADLGQVVAKHFSGRFQISGKAGRFKGGVVLRRGQIEENLSLEMIVRRNRSELVRVAADALFPEKADNDGVNAG